MFSRPIIFALLVLLFPSLGRSTDGPFAWLNWFESTNSSISGIGTDRAGHVYIAGSYAGSLKIGKQQLPFAKTSDIFIAKLTHSGRPMWVKQMDSGANDGVSRMVVDENGSVFLVGAWGTNSAVRRRSVEPGPFIARIDNGKLSWTASFVPEDEQGGIISLTMSLKDRSIWVLGYKFSRAFVKNYAQDGSVLSEFFVSEGCCGYLADIAVAGNGNLVLTGTLSFFLQPFMLGGSNITPYANGLQFTAALDPTGQLLWVWGAPSQWVGGTAGAGLVVETAPDGSVISAGRVLRSMFGGIGFSYAFVAKHTGDGTLLWMQTRGEHRGGYIAYDVAVDADNNVFMTGYAFGYAFNPDSRQGVLVVGYNADGTPFFEERINSVARSDQNAGTGICVDGKGRVTIAGYLTGSPIIGSNALPYRTSSPFVARLRQP